MTVYDCALLKTKTKRYGKMCSSDDEGVVL